MEGANVHDQILQLQMYNHDIGFFFSFDLLDSPFIKQMIIGRFTSHRPQKFSAIDSGNIFTPKDSRFKDLCLSLAVDPVQTLLCYEEKKRKAVMAVSNDHIIKTNLKPDKIALKMLLKDNGLSNLSLKVGLNISQTMEGILFELIKLGSNGLAESVIERAGRLHHPAYGTRYSECQLYIKALSLFCCEFGFSVDQLLRLMEMSYCFEISSYHLKKLLEYIANISTDTCIELTRSVIGSATVTQREVLLTDMLYMVLIGDYDVQTEFIAVERVGNLLDVNMDSVFMIYDKMKEIR